MNNNNNSTLHTPNSTLNKMRMESVDMTAQNIEKIGAMFPNCITETKDENGKPKKAINFDLLRQMLSGDVVEGDEAYEFTWVGKKAAIVEANKPIRKTLRPCPEESVDWDKTENLYIEGDNLEVLKLLQESYLGKVKMIYIDPPYNTGNDFVYADDFKMKSEEWSVESGEIDEEGNRLFKNTDSNGRFHSDWCSMIYSRLMLARNLLSNDGVIFISIDDNEQENLKKICDEVFGGENFVTNIHVELSTTQGMKVKAAKEGNIVKNAEYIISYSKDGHQNIAKNSVLYDYRPKYDEHYSLYKKATGEIVQLTELYDYRFPKDCRNEKPYKLSEAYAISKEFADIVCTHHADIVCTDKITGIDITEGLKNGYWKEIEKDGRNYLLTKDAKGNVKQLLRLSDSWGKTDGFYNEIGLRKVRGNWWKDFYIDMGNVSKEGNVTFANGKKPVRLIKQLAKLCTCNDDIILDFFSGSATTAHAVMQLNAEDGGKRKFIMVQLPEPCEEKSEAYKAGYKNICEIGKERIRRAGKKIKEESPLATADLDTGFRVFKLDSGNMNDVYYAAGDYTQDLLTMMESNVKEDRTDLDLLFGCLLEWGLPLSMPYFSENIDGFTVHTYGISKEEAEEQLHTPHSTFNTPLIACFDENISDEVVKTIAKRQPLRAVFRDASFNGSPAKINVFEIFKLLAPDTRVKVI